MLSMKDKIKEFVEKTDVRMLATAHGCRLKRKGNEWWSLCPFHNEKTPSFSVYYKNGRWRFKCFGCGKGGDAYDFMHLVYGCKNLREVLAHAKGMSYLIKQQNLENPPEQFHQKLKNPSAYAAHLWFHSDLIQGSPVELYLKKRGLNTDCIPTSIKYHPKLRHPDGEYFPAMLTCIHNPKNRIAAVHRTFLTKDGEKAPVEKPKLVLGPYGGGAIKFYRPGRVLGIAEGIETALSVYQDKSCNFPVWAAVSLNNMKAVILPDIVREVIYLADADCDRQNVLRILSKGAERFRAEGRKVTIAWPRTGMDFNDMAREELGG